MNEHIPKFKIGDRVKVKPGVPTDNTAVGSDRVGQITGIMYILNDDCVVDEADIEPIKGGDNNG